MDVLNAVAGLGLVLLIAGSVWWFSAQQRARRLLAAHPLCRIGDLRPGELVRVEGRVKVLGQMRGPMSGLPCAAYNLHVKEKASKNRWRVVGKENVAQAFEVVDDSGTCHVQPGPTGLFLTFDTSGQSGFLDDPSPEEQAILARVGVPATNFLGLNNTLRIDEATLSDGEVVTLLGRAQIIEVRGEPMLALGPDPEHGLVIMDRHV